MYIEIIISRSLDFKYAGLTSQTCKVIQFQCITARYIISMRSRYRWTQIQINICKYSLTVIGRNSCVPANIH